MLTKIYFDQKPVVLAEEDSPQLNDLKNRQDVLWISDAGKEAVTRTLNVIETSPVNAAVLLNGKPGSLLEEFKKQMHLVQAAGGLIYTDEGDVLLIFRKGKWDMAKGKLDEGEDLQTCALREINEETGLVHLSAESLLYVTYHTYHHKGRHVLKQSYWYLVKGDRNDPLSPQTSEDIEQCLWVKMSELDLYKANMHTSIVDVIEVFFETRKH